MYNIMITFQSSILTIIGSRLQKPQLEPGKLHVVREVVELVLPFALEREEVQLVGRATISQ